MQFVLDELSKSLKYHQKQLESNLNDIQRKKESIEMLESANLRHEQAIIELRTHIGELEKTEKAAT